MAEVAGLGDKGTVPGHRKSPAIPEKETRPRRSIRGAEEAALLRKAIGEKKEKAAGSAEEKTEASQALTSNQFNAEAGKRHRSESAASNNPTRNSRNEITEMG